MANKLDSLAEYDKIYGTSAPAFIRIIFGDFGAGKIHMFSSGIVAMRAMIHLSLSGIRFCWEGVTAKEFAEQEARCGF